MIHILTVCTGNICRSPLAERLLRLRLGDDGVTVESAGTHALVDHPMDPETTRLAVERGVPAADIAAHRGRWIRESHLVRPDLILAMSREHRRYVVELDPSRSSATFAIRELARLAEPIPDIDLRRIADSAGSDARLRLKSLLAEISSRRGMASTIADPVHDDVIDPYRRSRETYEKSAAALEPAVGHVVRVVRAALA